MLNVSPVRGFSDNYFWVIDNGRAAVVVDPGQAAPVADFLSTRELQLVAILVTHYHDDHIGGIDGLLDFLDLRHRIPVYGPRHELIPSLTIALQENDLVDIPALSMTLRVLDVPGHTKGHIAYVGNDMLFCGDTLFGCGCGRLFEGTPAQMLASMRKLKSLPGHTRVYCAHEYTLDNIRFAETVMPTNAALAFRKKIDQAKRAANLPTLPSTIDLERHTNPFLRWDDLALQFHVSQHVQHPLSEPIAVFAALREWKNNFR